MKPDGLERAIAILREPVDLGPGVDRLVLRAIAAEGRVASRPTAWRNRLLLAGLAAAAVVTAAVTLRPGAGAPPVEFRIAAPRAARVAVVGDFNDWRPAGTPLSRDPGSGEWRVRLALKPGRYRFGFLLDGAVWQPDPTLPPAPDPDFATPTSVITVGGSLP